MTPLPMCCRQSLLLRAQPDKRCDSYNWPIHPAGNQFYDSQTRNEQLLEEHRRQSGPSTNPAMFETTHGVKPNTLTWLTYHLELHESIDQLEEGALIHIKRRSANFPIIATNTNLRGRECLARTSHHACSQVEQEMHVAAVGSALRRLESIAPPHLMQVPCVPSDIR
jgi:hypothetical protein